MIIPGSVTSIGYMAFYYCTGLTNVIIIPGSVTSIGESAFGACTKLASVTIQNSVISIGVISIGKNAFSSTGLTSVTILVSVISIEDGAFGGTNLASVTFGLESNIETEWANNAFSTYSSSTTIYSGTSL